jgi:hypothetical protein
MDHALGVNYREPHVAVSWNILMGIDLMPHARMQNMTPEIRFDLAQNLDDTVGWATWRGDLWSASSDAKISSTTKSF